MDIATTGPSTTLSVNPATVVYGDPAVLTAVVGPPAGATGTVSFHEGSTLLGTSSLDGSTTAVLSVSILNAGTHTITATYNGDVNFPASTSNPVTVTVTQRTGPGGGASLTVTVNDATHDDRGEPAVQSHSGGRAGQWRYVCHRGDRYADVLNDRGNGGGHPLRLRSQD